MECKNEIVVNRLKFRVHPVFDQYAGSRCGKLVNIDRETILLGSPMNSNYLNCRVRASNTTKRKTVLLHRFTYEFYNGIIPEGFQIDHCNDDKLDNRLCNLQLVTNKENCIKGAKNRRKRSPPRSVVTINQITSERYYFTITTRTGKELGIVPPSIQSVCEGIKKCKIKV